MFKTRISWNQMMLYLMRNYLVQGVLVILTSPMKTMSKCLTKRIMQIWVSTCSWGRTDHPSSIRSELCLYNSYPLPSRSWRIIVPLGRWWPGRARRIPPGLGWMIWEFSACPEVSAFTARLTITRKIHKRKNGMKEELSATMWHRQHCLETYSSKTPSWSFTKLLAFYHWRSSLPPRLKAIKMGKEEELRQVDTDSHNHVERCGNNFARTMSTTILREWQGVLRIRNAAWTRNTMSMI